MDINHFKRMERALVTEEKSPHPTHKVGALICGLDHDYQYFERAHHNFWPDILIKHIGTDQKLGNASTTIHAELATLFTVPTSNSADIYITDLPCPNCAKTIAEAGIANVYIDSNTHNTPLGLKIKPYFDEVSMLIFKHAGIGVFEMNASEKTITTLLEQTSLNEPDEQAHIIPFRESKSQNSFVDMIKNYQDSLPFAACLAINQNDGIIFAIVQTGMSAELSEHDTQKIRDAQSKYAPTLQPLNRLLALCARYGLNIEQGYLFSSQTPTAREFVNIIGAGHKHLHIGDASKCRDEWGMKALRQLQDNHVMGFL